MKHASRSSKLLTFCILGFLTVQLLSSCCKSCSDWLEIYVSFEKYKKHETDSVLILKYKPNTNFSELIDSIYSVAPYYAKDSTASGNYQTLNPDTDYIIKFFSADVNKVFTFSNYEIIEKECGCDHELIKTINSFSVNGNTVYGYSYDLPR